jgi:hypothetical protein
MKKILLYVLLSVFFVNITIAQRKSIDELEYKRSSLYSILINHEEQKFAEEISDVFVDIPVSDKYNDHDLSVKILTVNKKNTKEGQFEDFLVENKVASRLVAKWFNRNILTGECNLDLIKKRGLYNASEFDKEIAAQSARGMAMLEDAGEELIANTFVLVNDVRYIDKEKQGQAAAVAMRILGTVAAVALNDNSFMDIGEGLGQMMETLKGFKVKVTTHLYRLAWTEDLSNDFFINMYAASASEEDKKNAFEQNRDKFKLEYVGKQISSGSDVSFMGVNLSEPTIMVRKACQRAIDENIANLQKNFESFKIKMPLSSVAPIQCPIGKKEGLSEQSKFEVLESVINEKGKTVYRRVAVIQPMKGMIWDNRYMAEEENAQGATLGVTTFKKISGGEILPGMLIREIK